MTGVGGMSAGVARLFQCRVGHAGVSGMPTRCRKRKSPLTEKNASAMPDVGLAARSEMEGGDVGNLWF